jgi:hypothetical protein
MGDGCVISSDVRDYCLWLPHLTKLVRIDVAGFDDFCHFASPFLSPGFHIATARTFAYYSPMGGERASKTRQRMTGEICCLCSNFLPDDPNHRHGERPGRILGLNISATHAKEQARKILSTETLGPFS